MGFNLPGKSTQTGTSGHSSALKMVTEQKAASAKYASPAKDGTAHDHPHDRLKDADGNEIPASGLEGMDKEGRPQKRRTMTKDLKTKKK